MNRDVPSLPSSFVEDLYKKLVTCVKASNGIPKDEEEYQYLLKSPDFKEGVSDLHNRMGGLLESLIQQNLPNKSEGDFQLKLQDLDLRDSKITDLVDTLLEEASECLDAFSAGKTSPAPKTPLAAISSSSSRLDKKGGEGKTADQTSSGESEDSIKPQLSFKDKIDNSSAPFIMKLRKKLNANSGPSSKPAEDDDGFSHPYYDEITTLHYPESQMAPSKGDLPTVPTLDCPLTWVDTVQTLKDVVNTLRQPSVQSFAVDLENHSYRSYQGFLCLMQISTWKEDFLIDTLALRSELHILNEVFTDPTKLKVLHGADMDILWLQRDLGLYVVNMFDTGQAARALKYPGFSLAYLLRLHCAISVDKQYQLADWRKRPLSKEMQKYAREDTRYLLYVYERMKKELLRKSRTNELLLHVYQQSAAICRKVYEKPQEWTEHEATHFCMKMRLKIVSNKQQIALMRLHEWRDTIARQDDESLGFVLGNKNLAALVSSMPTTPEAVVRSLRGFTLSTYVKQNLDKIVSIITSAITEAENMKEQELVGESLPTESNVTKELSSTEDSTQGTIVIVNSSSEAEKSLLWKVYGRKSAMEKAKDNNKHATIEFADATSISSSTNSVNIQSSWLVAEKPAKEHQQPTQETQDMVKDEPLDVKHEPQEPKSVAEQYNMSSKRKNIHREIKTIPAESKKQKQMPNDASSSSENTFQSVDYAAIAAPFQAGVGANPFVAATTSGPSAPSSGYNPFISAMANNTSKSLDNSAKSTTTPAWKKKSKRKRK